MILTPEDRTLLVGALDSLGVALAGHAHVWTVGEREIYERAMAILGVPVAEEPPPNFEAGEERE